jgi:hypothetical protein
MSEALDPQFRGSSPWQCTSLLTWCFITQPQFLCVRFSRSMAALAPCSLGCRMLVANGIERQATMADQQ